MGIEIEGGGAFRFVVVELENDVPEEFLVAVIVLEGDGDFLTALALWLGFLLLHLIL